MTTPFDIEGYTPENIFHNTKRLYNVGLILVHGPQKVHRNMVGYWPVGITPCGRKFVEAAKNVNKWAKAVAAFREHNEINHSETLKPLLGTLFAGGS